jgi:SAM-dependent methyltransferase
MGIGPEPQQMLRDLSLLAGFDVIELGDQMYHSGTRRDPKFWSKPAIHFYRKLGCNRYEAVDANGGGTILADLNLPLEPFPGTFDLVTDFGTSEHVFDIAQCWRTIHALCKSGGYIAFEKPFQGYPDHGFWNTHATLWRDLAKANDYELLLLKEIEAPRGRHWRGLMRKTTDAAFRNPQQGKWVPRLKI